MRETSVIIAREWIPIRESGPNARTREILAKVFVVVDQATANNRIPKGPRSHREFERNYAMEFRAKRAIKSPELLRIGVWIFFLLFF